MRHAASIDSAAASNQSHSDCHASVPEWLGFGGDPLPSAGLAAFVAAVRHGSIQAAADVLHLGQSAVTKRIQALEHRVGMPLLLRSRTGVTTTAAGAALAAEAHGLLAALTNAELRLRAESLAAPLRIWASQTAGEFLLPAWLTRYAAGRHDPVAHVTITTTSGVLTALRANPGDLGFVEGIEPPAGFEAKVVAVDHVRVVVSAGHPWAGRSAIDARRLPDEAYYARESGAGIRTFANDALAPLGVVLEPRLEVSSNAALRQAVQHGGYTLLSDLAVGIDDQGLALVPVRGVSMRRRILALRAPEASGRARALWRWLPTEFVA